MGSILARSGMVVDAQQRVLKKLILLFIWKTEKIFQRTGRNHRDTTRFISKRYWTARRWTHHLYVSCSGSDDFDRLFLFFQRNLVFPLTIEFSDQSSTSPLLPRHYLDEHNTGNVFGCMSRIHIFSHNFSSFFFPALSLLFHSLIPSSHTFL